MSLKGYACACPHPGNFREDRHFHSLVRGVSAGTKGDRSSNVSSSHPISNCGYWLIFRRRHSIRCNQASVTMRLCAGLSRAEFALLAHPRATSRATDSLNLFESRPLGLHGQDDAAIRRRRMVNFARKLGIVVAQSRFAFISQGRKAIARRKQEVSDGLAASCLCARKR
jgi:hypothetical protein